MIDIKKQKQHFLIKISLFLVLFFLLDMSIPYITLLALKSFNVTSFYEWKPVDVLVLGDSHTAFALNPSIFQQHGLTAENYSRNGHYSEFNYFFYQYYKQRYTVPKAVIISTPYFMFSPAEFEQVELLYNLRDAEQFTENYFKFVVIPRSKLYEYRMVIQRLPSFAYRMISDKAPVKVKYGYAINLNPYFETTSLATRNYHSDPSRKKLVDYVNDNYSKNTWYARRSLIFFQKLLDELHKDDVWVILIETPEYIDTQEVIINRDVFYTELEEEIESYSKVIFIRQHDISSIDFADKTLFFDGGYQEINSHLSFVGSKIYTEEIVMLLQKQLQR